MKVTKVLLGLASLATLAVPGTARADFILSPTMPIVGGTGLGTVNTILTITSQGSASTEAGCVSFGGVIGSNFSGGACTGSTADVQTGASQTQTRTIGQIGLTDASQFGIVLNAAEPGGNSITVGTLGLRIYSSTGTVLFETTDVLNQTFSETATGTGNSGFLFVLNPAQIAQANAAGAFANASNVIGFSASLSNATGGQETFFVANTGALQVVPEPSTYLLLGSGLLGVVGMAARGGRA
jgi:hypothetical protein